MRNQIIAVFILFAASLVFCGISSAQQSQSPSSTSSQKAPSATTAQKPPAAKTTTAAKPAQAPLTTDRQKESYALGMNIGRGLKNQSVDIDPAILLRGLKDTMAANGKPLLTDQEAMDELKKLQTDAQQKQQAKMKEEGEKNAADGTAFLEANKTKEGVHVLPDGLQYKVITEGTGPKPTATDTVVCQYRGTLIDGTEFDSSAKHGGPATFQVSRIIKGWTEALQLMPVGSKWELYIPASLAYGDRGAPGSPIGPNSTLIFEVELQSIKAPTAAAPSPAPAPQAAPAPNK
jgi:FKBP-type peptidyl-prolyl cis-trans isomerase FklB